MVREIDSNALVRRRRSGRTGISSYSLTICTLTHHRTADSRRNRTPGCRAAVMNTHELEKWLEHDEARTRTARAERLKLLVEEFGQEGQRWFFSGEQALMSF